MYAKYIPLQPNKTNNNFLRVELRYNLGGISWATGQNEPRGYYLHAQPVERGQNFESFTAFTGGKMLLKTVTRQTKKAENEAEQLAREHGAVLIAHVLAENGLQLA